MKKTVLSMFLSLILICSCSTQCVFATATNIDDEKQLVKSESEKSIIKIIHNIEKNERNQLDIKVTDRVQTFLNEKQDAYKYVREVNNFEKENLKVKTNLLEEKQEGSKYTLLYAVETEYNYKGEPIEEVSGEGFEVQVVIDLEKNQLIDIYEKEDAFDKEFRDDNISKATEIVELNKLPIIKTITDKAEKFKEEVLEQKKP